MSTITQTTNQNVVLGQTLSDLKHSILIVSLVTNLAAFIAWVAIVVA